MEEGAKVDVDWAGILYKVSGPIVHGYPTDTPARGAQLAVDCIQEGGFTLVDRTTDPYE